MLLFWLPFKLSISTQQVNMKSELAFLKPIPDPNQYFYIIFSITQKHVILQGQMGSGHHYMLTLKLGNFSADYAISVSSAFSITSCFIMLGSASMPLRSSSQSKASEGCLQLKVSV